MKQVKSMKLNQFQKFLGENNFILVRANKHLLYKHKSGRFLTVPCQKGEIGKLYIRDALAIITGVV